ncbi:unnamed protein product [Lampetra planeri]
MGQSERGRPSAASNNDHEQRWRGRGARGAGRVTPLPRRRGRQRAWPGATDVGRVARNAETLPRQNAF